jgi:hypothetical protein
MMNQLHQRDAARQAASTVERLLCSLGVNEILAEQVFGDLAECYEERVRSGSVAWARLWYAREILRSAPHLGWSAIRDGGPRERARLAACAAGLVTVISLGFIAASMRVGPPARLFAGTGAATDAIVVNNIRPTQIPVRVVDAKGRRLDPTDVRYHLASGAPLSISNKGVVTCASNGDAVVRASAGSVATNVEVHCRPVERLDADTWMTLFPGSPPRDLPFVAIGIDDRPVTELRGELRVRDSTIAMLSGSTIRPVAAGETAVTVGVGDRTATIRVLVHEMVKSFTGLRPDQRLVAVNVRLARGDTVRYALPLGVYWLKYIPRRAGDAPPTIMADVMCAPRDGVHIYRIPLDEHAIYCPLHVDGAVTLGHGFSGPGVVEGTLAVERVPEH